MNGIVYDSTTPGMGMEQQPTMFTQERALGYAKHQTINT